MFKNLGYLEQQENKQLNTYSQIMRNNEELLASHLRLNNKSGSESGDTDTSHLVTNNTHTSQVRLVSFSSIHLRIFKFPFLNGI